MSACKNAFLWSATRCRARSVVAFLPNSTNETIYFLGPIIKREKRQTEKEHVLGIYM
jgi:hypothetical protein